MGKVVLVTSCKGGVGKSTVSSFLAFAMAELFAPTAKKIKGVYPELTEIGKRVLLVDCDFGVRSLDLMLGAENYGIYDLGDVVNGGVPISDAIRPVAGKNNLDLLAAPMDYTAGSIDPERFCRMIDDARQIY